MAVSVVISTTTAGATATMNTDTTIAMGVIDLGHLGEFGGRQNIQFIKIYQALQVGGNSHVVQDNKMIMLMYREPSYSPQAYLYKFGINVGGGVL